MRAERWQRVVELFEAALERPPGARADFLDAACAGEDPLRREVEAMLEADARAGHLFTTRPSDLAAELLDDLPAPPGLAGRHVGPYRLEREIGRGGMGAVYLARREDVDLEVALKVATGGLASPARIARFHTERRLLARMQHPSIARLLDAGVLDDGTPWFAMEHVAGRPLDAFCDERALTVAARLDLFSEVCRAVAYAHRNLVVHRDLKPSNILVTDSGVPKLLDFGIAKLLEDGGEADHHTRAGARLLTPGHAAPEQVLGEPVTTATDVYLLGILLYRLLAGSGPWAHAGTNPRAVERAVLEDDPPPPSRALARAADASVAAARSASPARLRRLVEGELDAIVLRAMAREPDGRYASAEQLLADVRAYREGRPVAARPATRRYRLAKFVRRHKGPVAAAAALATLLTTSAVAMAVQRAETGRERDRARLEAAKAEQVSDFLAGLFRAGDPYQGSGSSMPVGELLAEGRERLDELADQPELHAEMMEVLGRVYLSLGEVETGRDLHAGALEIRRELHGEMHADVAESMNSSGRALSAAGLLDSAAVLHRRALEIQRALGLVETIDHATVLMDLGTVLHRRAEYPEAVEHYRAALELYQRLLRFPHVRIAQAQANLGLAYSGQQLHDEAEAFKRAAVSTFRALPGDQSANLAQAYNNLAVTLERRGEPVEAEAMHRAALEAKRASLPPGHPSIGVSMTNLGSVLVHLEAWDEAETLFAEALPLQRAALGPDHRYVVNALNGLAEVAEGRGLLDLAEARWLEALDIVSRTAGAEHPRAATVLLRLGRVRQARGDPQGAEALLRRAVGIRATRLGETAVATATARTALAGLLIDVGRFDEAEALLVAARSARTSGDDADEPATAPGDASLRELVRLYEAWGREDRAAEARSALAAAGGVAGGG